LRALEGSFLDGDPDVLAQEEQEADQALDGEAGEAATVSNSAKCFLDGVEDSSLESSLRRADRHE
jgi:hypothetical protein